MPSEPVTVTLKSGTVITIQKMTGLESMRADVFGLKLAKSCNAEADMTDVPVAKVYSVCSIRAIAGKPVNPLNNFAEFMAVSVDLDVDDLVNVMGEVFPDIAADAGADALKNS